MKNRKPTSAKARPPLPDFTPVPRKCNRHDGWTPERQRAFIEALAATGSVTHAAHAVNMAKEGAYQLRLHPEAAEFRAAWDQALDFGVNVLVDTTMERAIHGVPVPIVYKGEVVAERRWYNDRLAMFHMRHRLPDRYGALNPPGRGTKHPETQAREAAGSNARGIHSIRRPLPTEEEVNRSLEKKLEVLHLRLLKEKIIPYPDKLAAWELLNGPLSPEKRRRLGLPPLLPAPPAAGDVEAAER